MSTSFFYIISVNNSSLNFDNVLSNLKFNQFIINALHKQL
jgi:hypothetical protein